MFSPLTEINNKLDDLKTSNPLLPPDANATGTLEVVPVHDHVHSQVEYNGDPRDRGGANELRVAEKSRGTMVVAVEEGWHRLAWADNSRVGDFWVRHTERLLLQEQEDGIKELEVLGEVVKLVKRSVKSSASRPWDN
jgi:hypothetical protein